MSEGKLSDSLVQKNSEKIAHSRWLTTTNRILRLYVSTDKPSQIMITIVEYIMKVYAHLWFKINGASSSQSGAFHLFKTI